MAMSQSETTLSTGQKALQLNLDASWYGTFAEIGAGQEVARWFFAVGGAAGTVAKTISAYSMTVSDGIYGKSQRYVSRERLEQMLEHEYASLQDSLAGVRGEKTSFFVFADTVATRSYARRVDGDGWLGIKFQHQPGSETSRILLHTRLLDPEAKGQQEALGLLGVNLVYAAWRLRSAGLDGLVLRLGEEISRDRLEVDFIDVSGPMFAGADVRRLNLNLVLNHLTHVAVFEADGRAVEGGGALYKRAAFVLREHFRPFRDLHRDMLVAAREQLASPDDGERAVTLAEISVTNPLPGVAEPGTQTAAAVETDELLARLDALAAAGLATLVTDFGELFRVALYLRRYAAPRIVFVIGTPAFTHFFSGRPFEAVEGGAMEALGRLLTRTVRIALYPEPDPRTGRTVSARTMPLPPEYTHLRDYLFDNGFVHELRVLPGG
jgi:hypothetical protein